MIRNNVFACLAWHGNYFSAGSLERRRKSPQDSVVPDTVAGRL